MLFGAQAKVCDDYFVPSIEACSKQLRIPDDVAGATLMAFGCNGPELFVNGIALFITHSDVGTGTIVGSEIFNLLCIVGGSVLVAPLAPLPVERYAFTRDVSFYAVATLLLGLVMVDGSVTRPESLGLVAMAGVYALAVKETPSILASFGITRCSDQDDASEDAAVDVPLPTLDAFRGEGVDGGYDGAECIIACGVPVPSTTRRDLDFECKIEDGQEAASSDTDDGGFSVGRAAAAAAAAVSVQVGDVLGTVLQPLDLALTATVPDCKVGDIMEAPWVVAFGMSMAWLAAMSYAVCVVADQLTVDFGIPSAVVGLTVAAVGTSFANLWSSLGEARKGKVEMALSNGLGSNIQNVFLALAVPWALRLTLLNGDGAASIALNPDGIVEGVAVMGTTLLLFVGATLLGEPWTLDKTSAKLALLTYAAYLLYACAPAVMG